MHRLRKSTEIVHYKNVKGIVARLTNGLRHMCSRVKRNRLYVESVRWFLLSLGTKGKELRQTLDMLMLLLGPFSSPNIILFETCIEHTLQRYKKVALF